VAVDGSLEAEVDDEQLDEEQQAKGTIRESSG
jgi:hypothetical protein